MAASCLRLHISSDDTLGVESSSSLEAHEESDKRENRVRKVCCFDFRSIPYLKLVMDIWFGIASGMTVKFFPLWLTDLGLSQLELNGVVAMQYLAISVLALGMKQLGGTIGRMQVALLCRVAGLCLLVTIIVGEPFFWNLKWLCAALQIFRTGLMNAAAGISASVLNDFLPKDKRARWNALDQVTNFGWSVSALLGG